MQLTRRDFIRSSLGFAITAMSLNQTAPSAAGRVNTLPIGFQLYTVRGEFSRDVPNTLKTLGQLGYDGVEFWGYGGTPNVYQKFTAVELRKLLDQSGLRCCGMHLQLKALEAQNLERTIETNRVLGSQYLNVAAAEEKMHSHEGIIQLAAFLTEVSEKCQPHQMQVGYHAHPFDFAKVHGMFAWELLFSRLGPQINMQMDVGNCLAGNGDPIAMLKEFPGRTRSIHIKEHEAKTFDSDYYKEVFDLCETSCGTKWYIVEMGGSDGNGFDVPRTALAKLRRLGK
ncbi:MAG TPA: TIM barrel protein [Candidatus Limnocylindrales bacterium]|nr:TIM barrel protein [Candidatus Limnocylindrales bacterium]